MNREIKFRAWDNKNKFMLDASYGDWVSFDGIPYTEASRKYNTPNIEIERAKDYILMQFTGLHDKNGKEIYCESDVLAHNENKYVIIDSKNIGTVAVCLNKNFGDVLKSGIINVRQNWRDFNWIYRMKQYIEVIGNIHENPELLNQ